MLLSSKSVLSLERKPVFIDTNKAAKNIRYLKIEELTLDKKTSLACLKLLSS
jgi:hypothetical protein